MKRLLSFSFVLAAVFASCSKEGTIDNPAGSKGSISISASRDTGAIIEKASTKTLNTDAYWVTITGPDGYFHEDSFANITPISNLDPGSYTVTIVSDKDYTHPALDIPLFKGSVTQTLKAAPEITKFDVTCYQDNVGIRFAFDPSMSYYENIKAIVEVSTDASKKITYLPSHEEAGNIFYFEAPSKLKISLMDGLNNVAIGGEAFQEIEVSKKELWTIKLKTSSTAQGGADFEVDVDTGTVPRDPEFGVGDISGDGSLLNPYTVNDAINVMPKQNVWIEGVIVGNTTTETRATSTFNILIGKSKDATPAQSIILALDHINESALFDELNLMDNPQLKGQTIKIKGDIAGRSDDYTSSAFAVLQNVTEYDIYEGNGLGSIDATGKVLKDAPFKVGFAVQTYLLDSDPEYLRTIKRDASSITGEYAMKMDAIWKSKDVYDFSGADMLVKFAEDNGIRVHGHTLIWHDGTPDWLRSFNGTREEWIALMEGYITKVMTHYKGRVAAWDVVNEAYVNNGELLGNDYSVWRKNIGDDYIELAFRAARAADPNCILFYNDYGNEYDAAKHAAILNMIDLINVPENYVNGKKLIDGLGMQMHTEIWNPRGQSQKDLLASAAVHVDYIHLSELDIKANVYDDFKVTDKLDMIQEQEQANAYKEWFEAFMSLDPSKRYGITFWGVDDGHSWLRHSNPSLNRPYPDWPLLFNEDYTPKLAYGAILEYIAGQYFHTR